MSTDVADRTLRSRALFLALALTLAGPATAAEPDIGWECDNMRQATNDAAGVKDWPRVENFARRILSDCPYSAKTWEKTVAELASALRESGRDNEALSTANWCLERQPKSMVCTVDRGFTLWTMGRFIDAQATFEEATKIRPRTAEEASLQKTARQMAGTIAKQIAARR